MFWPEYRTGSCIAQACDIALAHPLQLLSSLRLYPHWAETWLKNLQRRFWFAYWIFWFVLHSQLHVHGDGQDLGNDAQDEFPGRIDGWKTDWVCNLKTSRWDSLSKESGVSCKSSWDSNPKTQFHSTLAKNMKNTDFGFGHLRSVPGILWFLPESW